MLSELSTVTKRDGRQVPFDEDRIRLAILKCLTHGVGLTAATSGSIVDQVTLQATMVLRASEKPITVEYIQDVVEFCLMAGQHYGAAKAYILYRENRSRVRELPQVTIDPVDAEKVRNDLAQFKHPIQIFQTLGKYARWVNAKNRRETWPETVDRSITYLQGEVGKSTLTDEEWIRLYEHTLQMEALPSMRLLQMAGPAAERCNVCIYNCSYIPLKDWKAFAELLYVLMSGTGAGFSVESEFVDELPKIKKQKGGEPHHCDVADTTEGWCNALLFGLEKWAAGEDVIYHCDQIRPAGSRLKTKGGRASGPEPLLELLSHARRILLSRQGKRLTSDNAHDIACWEGKVTCMGGVRRSALISLFDNDDELMRRAKHGEFWTNNIQRFQSNNSAVFTEQPSQQEFLEKLWLPLMISGTGEPGVFNREGIIKRMPKRRQKLLTGANRWIGVNPCGEIALRPFEFCNLSIAVARQGDTEADLMRKVEIATIYGTLQSTLTRFGYLRPEWMQNCEAERLLGVDINGWQDCELLRYGAPGRVELMERLKTHVLETNRLWAERLGINPSAATTCVKPSGNSSEAVQCSPGLHAREFRKYIRRVRANRSDPLTQLMKDAGVPWSPENGETVEDHTTVVFSFPVASPEGALTYDSMSAIDQFYNWLEIRRHWTEHNPSVTIRVKADEWLELGALVYQNWEDVGGVSFLPRSEHIYEQAPYESISDERYDTMMATFPEIPWERLPYYEQEDTTEVAKEFACTSGGCTL